MKKVIFLMITVVLPVLLGPVDSAWGQEETLSPEVKYQSVFEVANPPAQFEMVQLVEEFGYEAWLPEHSHTGPGFATVLEGTVTVQAQEVEKRYEAGETFVEPAGITIAVGNVAPQRAKLMLTFLLPKGAELTTRLQSGLSERTPVVKYQNQFEAPQIPSPFNLNQMAVDLVPGAWLPLDSPGGQGLATVLKGAITVQQGDLEKTYQAGESFVETSGEAMMAGNAGTEPASLVITFLLPKDAQLTTAPTETSLLLPETGGESGYSVSLWLLLAGMGLIAGGWLGRRWWEQA
jgi:quercetin dioxygenase-like cupin family protein